MESDLGEWELTLGRPRCLLDASQEKIVRFDFREILTDHLSQDKLLRVLNLGRIPTESDCNQRNLMRSICSSQVRSW